jgi:hypothetical protein
LSSPNRIDDGLAERTVEVRAALERSELDHGPISVQEKRDSRNRRGQRHGIRATSLPPPVNRAMTRGSMDEVARL